MEEDCICELLGAFVIVRQANISVVIVRQANVSVVIVRQANVSVVIVRQANVSVVMSVCPHEQLGSHWTDFNDMSGWYL